eukprot:gene846-871_t
MGKSNRNVPVRRKSFPGTSSSGNPGRVPGPAGGALLQDVGEMILDLRKELYRMRLDAQSQVVTGQKIATGELPPNRTPDLRNFVDTLAQAEKKLLQRHVEVVETSIAQRESKQEEWSGGQTVIDPRIAQQMQEEERRMVLANPQSTAASSKGPSRRNVGGYRPRNGPMIESKKLLPKKNRVDACQAPPDLTEGDLEDGLHSLINRRFIPKDADCTPFFERCTRDYPIPSVIAGPAQIHYGTVGSERLARTYPMPMTNVVFDRNNTSGKRSDQGPTEQTATWTDFQDATPTNNSYPARKPPAQQGYNQTNSTHGYNDNSFSNTFFTEVREYAGSPDPMDISSPEISPRGTAPLALTDQPGAGGTSSALAIATFEIRDGHIMRMHNDFIHFKASSQRSSKWPRIKVLIDGLEKCCRRYKVPQAIVIQNKVNDVAFEGDLEFLQTVEMGIFENAIRRRLAELCYNWQTVSAHFRIPGLRFRVAIDAQAQAASYMQAVWCMIRTRRWYRTLRKKEALAFKLQNLWRGYKELTETRSILRERRKRRLDIVSQLEMQFAEEYSMWNQSRPPVRRVEVHIAALPMARHRKGRMQKFSARQNAQFGRIFKVLEDCVDVVYVTADDIHDEILDYVTKIMQFRGIQKPGGRFQIVKPENAKLKPGMSTALALQISQKAMERVRALTKNRNAYVVPGSPSPDILNLCAQLGLPLLGAGADAGTAQGMTMSANRCGTQALVNSASLPSPPHAVDLYCDKDLFEALSELQLTHREHGCWVFKIGDEIGARATAYIDLRGGNDVRLKGLHENFAAIDENPMDAKELAGAFTAELERVVPKIAAVANPRAYPSWEEFKAEFFRVGGVIQAVPSVPGVVHATVHIRVEPSLDGCRTRIIGTTEPIFVPGRPLVKAASFCPALHANYPALKQVGMKLGEAAASQGILGHMSVDVLFFPNPNPQQSGDETEANNEPHIIGHTALPPDQQMIGELRSASPSIHANNSTASLALAVPEGQQFVHNALQEQYADALANTEKQEQENSTQNGGASGSLEDPGQRAARLVGGDSSCQELMWVVDVSCRLTNEACALFPMLFTSQTEFDESTGMLRLSSRGAKMLAEAKALQGSDSGVVFENAALQEERFGLIAPQAMCPGLNKCDYAGAFHAAKMSNLSFDLLTNTGLLFNFLDVFESLVSLTTVARTPQACVSQLAHGLTVVSDIERATNGAAGKQTGAGADSNHDEYDDLYVRDQQAALRQMGRKFAQMREHAEKEREEYLYALAQRDRLQDRLAVSGPL